MTSIGRLARAALLGAAGLALLAGAASACPQCASRDGMGVGAVVSMGAMILLPFAIVGVIVPVLRRGPGERT